MEADLHRGGAARRPRGDAAADGPRRFDLDRTIDRLVTSRVWGVPLMFAMLTAVFWLTIAGANVPSGMLATLLVDTLHPLLKSAGDGSRAAVVAQRRC